MTIEMHEVKEDILGNIETESDIKKAYKLLTQKPENTLTSQEVNFLDGRTCLI